ncbi:MAG: hypothetical protein QOJ16_109 [Acidobacteriota bacterium]|nr:hypothetical protein [Acidobacteriota bacterium]
MNPPTLGRLERVDLRKAWVSESSGFTPWLAPSVNLKLLGDAIGLELELEAQEKEVGPFRADLLCKVSQSESWVLIENQLELTDHRHLGQILTYAAGLKAVTIVWVAQTIREEHRAALDWLNSVTTEQINFFGLEIELWKIGDSPFAPKFNVVSKPNNWSKRVTEGVEKIELSETRALQLEFWTAFRQFVEARGSKLRLPRPLGQSWMWIPLGRTGFTLSAIASSYNSAEESWSGHELRAEMQTSGPKSKAAFALLEAERVQIEAELGQELTWLKPTEAMTCRTYLRQPADLRDRKGWPENFAWLLRNLEALHRVFAPRVKALQLPESAGMEAEEAG